MADPLQPDTLCYQRVLLPLPDPDHRHSLFHPERRVEAAHVENYRCMGPPSGARRHDSTGDYRARFDGRLPECSNLRGCNSKIEPREPTRHV
jgi:hypothetical protein